MSDTKLQHIICKCGVSIAACRVPECYEDAGWQREMRKYVKRGYTVELIDAGSHKFERCSCKKEKDKQLDLL